MPWHGSLLPFEIGTSHRRIVIEIRNAVSVVAEEIFSTRDTPSDREKDKNTFDTIGFRERERGDFGRTFRPPDTIVDETIDSS